MSGAGARGGEEVAHDLGHVVGHVGVAVGEEHGGRARA